MPQLLIGLGALVLVGFTAVGVGVAIYQKSKPDEDKGDTPGDTTGVSGAGAAKGISTDADTEPVSTKGNSVEPSADPTPPPRIVQDLRSWYGIPEDVAQAVVQTSVELGANPKHVAAVINFESAQRWSSNVRNPNSNATGTIQFMPATARRMGTTVDALARMTVVEQLRGPVKEYFRRVRDGEWYDGTQWAPARTRPYPAHPLDTFQAVAMSVFFPLFRSPSNLRSVFPNRVIDQNAGLRTPAQYLAKVERQMPDGAEL